ncbi:hypothetical protein MPSEU_000217900 [Mayamaea pseudoterrestris]|nr:hypothetical protein MPSEU_000217900 [Mayamaea pseudoterrestris]
MSSRARGHAGGNASGSANEGQVAAQAPQQNQNGELENLLDDMWSKATHDINYIAPEAENWKIQALPLARIKKIMKSEEFVMQEMEKDRCIQQGIDPNEKTSIKFMISAEAPLVMSKACELLIRELSVRAWQHTARNRRRTLQRQDIHAAVGESDVYDFLIDIIPRVATHRLPAPNAVPVDMSQVGQALVVQNFGIPPGQMNINLPAAMLQHAGNITSGAPSQVDFNAILEQHHQQLNPEQLMQLGYPAQLPNLTAHIDNTNGQQQQNHNNGAQQQPSLQQLAQAQQQAIAAASRMQLQQQQQHQSDQQPSQWSNP